jgi:ATP-dependent RNA helicase DDX21
LRSNSKVDPQEEHVSVNENEVTGSFKNFPEISAKTIESLKARGINYLFPVQSESFVQVWKREDLMVRDLTGSGKTLGYALPTVEYLRKHKLLGNGKT